MPDQCEPATEALGSPVSRSSPGHPDERRPTSHERAHGQPWDASYIDGPAPWDVGAPQPAVVRLAEAGGFTGEVLDAGCGTGENALHIATLGLAVLGIDVAGTALAMARDKARQRGTPAGLPGPSEPPEFREADALQLGQLDRGFDTVLDCGLFHTFDADERERYLAGLTAVLRPGGRLQLLCLSDSGPDVGPHPVSRSELLGAFTRSGWRLDVLEPDRIETRFHEHGAPAWRVTVSRR